MSWLFIQLIFPEMPQTPISAPASRREGVLRMRSSGSPRPGTCRRAVPEATDALRWQPRVRTSGNACAGARAAAAGSTPLPPPGRPWDAATPASPCWTGNGSLLGCFGMPLRNSVNTGRETGGMEAVSFPVGFCGVQTEPLPAKAEISLRHLRSRTSTLYGSQGARASIMRLLERVFRHPHEGACKRSWPDSTENRCLISSTIYPINFSFAIRTCGIGQLRLRQQTKSIANCSMLRSFHPAQPQKPSRFSQLPKHWAVYAQE